MGTTPWSSLEGSAPDAARRLLGSELIRTLPDQTVMRARIVETEAYDEQDPGSHSHRGATSRTMAMFGPAGFAYVYFIYGAHYCLNVTTGPKGRGEAVLIRAVEPLEGINAMRTKRNVAKDIELSNGPGKLCAALGIDRSLNNHDLRQRPLQLILRAPLDRSSIIQTTRIGLTKGTEALWRFYISNNPYRSRP